MSMHNPCHAGEVLKEYLGDTSISTAAKHLGVTRAALSRIINGKTGISADMAVSIIRLTKQASHVLVSNIEKWILQ